MWDWLWDQAGGQGYNDLEEQDRESLNHQEQTVNRDLDAKVLLVRA